MAEAEGQDSRIEEPEAFARLLMGWIEPDREAMSYEDGTKLVRARDAEVAAAARREVLEACCAAVCGWCKRGESITPYKGRLVHWDFGGKWMCEAEPIRRLAAERGWLPADRLSRGMRARERRGDAGTKAV